MESIKKQLKQDKGSITMTVLASMLLITSVIVVSFFSISNKSIDQDNKIRKSIKQYEITDSDAKQKYNQTYNEYVENLVFDNGLGDVNSDEQIDLDDVDLINLYLDGTNSDFTGKMIVRADINKDGEITQEDVVLLQQYIDENNI